MDEQKHEGGPASEGSGGEIPLAAEPAPDQVDGGGGAEAGNYFLCPFCGGATRPMARCEQCKGFLDPLSRQATQNVMGPWFVRDPEKPFRPGCNFETLAQLVLRGQVDMRSIVRGPTTNQFWMPARRTPGVANLLGVCHACAGPVSAEDASCGKCGAEFPRVGAGVGAGVAVGDRQSLGLLPVRPLPGQSPPEVIAAAMSSPPATRPTHQTDERPDRQERRPTSKPEPTPEMLARVQAIEAQSRALWAWLCVSLVLGFGLLALVLAGFGAGVISWSTEAKSDQAAPAGSGGGGGDQTPPVNKPEAKPEDSKKSEPKTEEHKAPEPAGESKPKADAPKSPVSLDTSPSDETLAKARALMALNTPERLNQAVRLLEDEVKAASGGRAELLRAELKAAKGMLAAAVLAGMR